MQQKMNYKILIKSLRVFFISTVIIFVFSSCVKPIPKHRRIYTKGEIVKIFYNKEYCRIKFIDSLGNEIIGSYIHIFRGLKLGEKYTMAYDKDDIDNVNIYFTAPVIEDTLKYSNSKAIITRNSIAGHNNSNYSSFIYRYNGSRYKRFQHLVDRNIKKGDTVDILINKNRPEIAYVKGSNSITK